MLTGQISSHALQLVHAQISSDVIRSNSELAPIVISGSVPSGGDTTGLPVAAITSPVLSTISRGSSGLPVAWAGHTLVQRPHIVQASVSSSCFHVKSSTTEAPNVSSSVSARFGIGFIAPFGRDLVLEVHVQRRREHVAQHRDRQDREEHDERQRRGRSTTTGATSAACRPTSRRRAATSGQPMKLHFSKSMFSPSADCRAMRNISAAKPERPMTRNVPRMSTCSGLDLMRMRYGRCT